MRTWLSTVFVGIAAVAGYLAAPGRPVSAQIQTVPFTTGQSVLLTFESGRNQQWCTVTMQHGDFLGCAVERAVGREERVIWYNLRFVERLEKRER